MTTGMKVLTGTGVVIAAFLAFGMYARGESRDRMKWYCENALDERHGKDGYTFAYPEPSMVTYESPLYQMFWVEMPATYVEGDKKIEFKTDAMCIFDSRARKVKAISLGGNDLPYGQLPHIAKTLKEIGYKPEAKCCAMADATNVEFQTGSLLARGAYAYRRASDQSH